MTSFEPSEFDDSEASTDSEVDAKVNSDMNNNGNVSDISEDSIDGTISEEDKDSDADVAPFNEAPPEFNSNLSSHKKIGKEYSEANLKVNSLCDKCQLDFSNRGKMLCANECGRSFHWECAGYQKQDFSDRKVEQQFIDLKVMQNPYVCDYCKQASKANPNSHKVRFLNDEYQELVAFFALTGKPAGEWISPVSVIKEMPVIKNKSALKAPGGIANIIQFLGNLPEQQKPTGDKKASNLAHLHKTLEKFDLEALRKLLSIDSNLIKNLTFDQINARLNGEVSGAVVAPPNAAAST
jgi:hypothetical protein